MNLINIKDRPVFAFCFVVYSPFMVWAKCCFLRCTKSDWPGERVVKDKCVFSSVSDFEFPLDRLLVRVTASQRDQHLQREWEEPESESSTTSVCGLQFLWNPRLNLGRILMNILTLSITPQTGRFCLAKRLLGYCTTLWWTQLCPDQFLCCCEGKQALLLLHK